MVKMKIRRKVVVLAACLGMSLAAGCGDENKQIFDEAMKDLELGSYEYALDEFTTVVQNGSYLEESYRGMGICQLRLGMYGAAAESFSCALNKEHLGKSMTRDLYLYRATARLLDGRLEDAMADCQMLQQYEMDADSYFLTGKVALAMDGYDEASYNFSQAYGEDSSYDRAIQIYETYLEKDMEADGTRYLEAVLANEAKDGDDLCARGRIYYYMEDYVSAGTELTAAVNKGNCEALLVLGMVYGAQSDYANARAMYSQYVSQKTESSDKKQKSTAAPGYNGLALCDLAEGNYDLALEHINTGISLSNDEEMQSLLFNEIVAYEKKLDFQTAREKALSYVSMYPEDPEGEKELAFLNSRIGEAL